MTVMTGAPGHQWLKEVRDNWEKHERGSLPTLVEMAVITWVQVDNDDNVY